VGDTDGTPFGRYRLIELLGRGGMGEVWRAYDTQIERTVALKVLPANYANDPQYRERFRREALKAASLNQRHIVTILDVGEFDGRLFVTMPVIEGRDLQAVLDDGPLPPQRAIAIVEQVAAALTAAHTAGLVHRDVKPSNILVSEDDFAYLIDFGIARAAGETGLTSTGLTVGTWSYMAPERFRTGEIQPSADTYALACVLYQCMTGQVPFPGQTFEQIAMAHLAVPPPKPSAHDPTTIPFAMDEVIAIGLAKDPAARYRSPSELAAAARHALSGGQYRAPYPGPWAPIQSPAPPPPQYVWQQPAISAPRSSSRAALVAPLLLVVLLVAAVAFAVTQFLRPEPQLSIAPRTWQPYVDSAKQFAIALTSLSYQDPDTGIQRILDESTGAFRDDFSQKSGTFKQTVVDSKVITQGTVKSAALDSISGTTAQVLVATTSEVTNSAGAKQDPRNWRLAVQVEKVGDAFKASKVEFVP
jgi:serine/threonine protein kinase